MPYFYNFDVSVDFDMSTDEFFHACSDREKEELKELILDHFNMPLLDGSVSLADAVVIATKASGMEAKEYIKRVIEDLEYRLKMHDFS